MIVSIEADGLGNRQTYGGGLLSERHIDSQQILSSSRDWKRKDTSESDQISQERINTVGWLNQ